MRTKQNTAVSFKDQDLYVGVDVHKKQWTIKVETRDISFGRPRSIEPSPVKLLNYLEKHFPDGNYHAAYEAGFSGFWAARELKEIGVDCIVVNAADVPTNHKEKARKNDRIDSRKLARTLKNGDLTPIYVPDRLVEEWRFLNRHRLNLRKDRTRMKGRIKGKLNYFGMNIPIEYQGRNWSGAFIKWLSSQKFETEYGQYAMNSLIDQLLDVRKRIADTVRQMRKLSKTDPFKRIIPLLLTIPGIGFITAMTLVTEIVDMNRFSNFEKLVSFIGLAPDIQSSDETENNTGITARSHNFMRSLLIESAWISLRVDPALTAKYGKLVKRMKPNRAIIRIAKSLLSRIRYVWLNQKPYVKGVVSTNKIKKS
ncbi:MAG: IS110 family transposase [Calditrichales bacterium]|nr:IS110 family transposase [Calditrichales bacterium]